MSTESSVDLIVISSLNCSWRFCCWTPPYELVASSLAVLILQTLQKSTSLLPSNFIFALQDGQDITTFFFIGLSISVLHFMSGHLYFQNFFFIVG